MSLLSEHLNYPYTRRMSVEFFQNTSKYMTEPFVLKCKCFTYIHMNPHADACWPFRFGAQRVLI